MDELGFKLTVRLCCCCCIPSHLTLAESLYNTKYIKCSRPSQWIRVWVPNKTINKTSGMNERSEYTDYKCILSMKACTL